MDILTEAQQITSNDRADAYGDFGEQAGAVTASFTAITGIVIEPKHFPLIMMLCKMHRENHRHKRDNLVDIAGYAQLWDKMENG